MLLTGALRRGPAADLGRGDRHGHVRRGRNSNRHNDRDSHKNMNDLDDDDNFSMRFQTLDEVLGQVCVSGLHSLLCGVHSFESYFVKTVLQLPAMLECKTTQRIMNPYL